MNKLSVWMVVGAVAAGLVVSGCGSSGGSSNSAASLRLANATLTHPSLDLLVNSTVAVSGVAVDTASAYVAPSSGSTALQVNDAGTGTALVATVPTLTAGGHYTLIAYESGGVVKTAMLGEDAVTPTSGTAQLRIYDLALDAGKVDVYITAPGTDLSTVASPTLSLTAVVLSSLLTYTPGTYQVRVTGYGNKNDLRLDIASVTLANQQIGTVVLTPGSGGLLLDGATVIQQSTYAATRNTNARVRLAAAVSGNAVVAASATTATGTSTIDSGSVAPAYGYYVLVPATAALNISVNGSSVGAPAGGLTAGSDQTLLVYGDPGSAVATLLTDDNRLPADTTSVKLRLINGITGNSGGLALTANSAPVASSILPGTASSYSLVPGSTNAMNLVLTSTVVPGVLLQDNTNVLNVKSVYSVMAVGDISRPKETQFLIR